MLTVTERAAERLRESIEATDIAEDQTLRLVQTDAGLELAIDEEREGDQVVQSAGRTVLVIDPEVGALVDGATLDAVEGPQGARLVLQGPGQS